MRIHFTQNTTRTNPHLPFCFLIKALQDKLEARQKQSRSLKRPSPAANQSGRKSVEGRGGKQDDVHIELLRTTIKRTYEFMNE